MLIGLLLFSSQAVMSQAEALPRAFNANFSVAKGHLTLGELHASLKYQGNRYHYKKQTKASGLAALLTGIKIIENTDGRFSKETLQPVDYLFNQTSRTKSRVEKIHFNGNLATGSYKGTPFKVAIKPDTLDRGSLELAVARDVAMNKPQLTYPVVEKGEIKTFSFARLGKETIKTPAGAFNTVKLSVVRNTNKRKTTFWLAQELDYMPVKIRHNEKGDVITTVIKNYKM